MDPSEIHKTMTIRPIKHDKAVNTEHVPKPAPEKKPDGLLFERVEEMSCPHCGDFVHMADVRPLSLVPCPHCGGRVFAAARLANFLFHSNLGQGEMGSVYRATDETLNREVAIKLLRGSYAGDPEACERLRKEARALGRMNHSRVAQVYALSFSNGHPYLVMELVTGEDFDKKVKEEGHLDERVVLRMAGDVADGLAALNREGLVHSDIKPGNIVMDRDGNSKLVDFGLTGMTRYDSNHNLMGTPDYIAPELILGAPDTQSSDMFSLGATLYHLLSGRLPNPGEDPTQVLKARIDKKPIQPLQDVAPKVSSATCKMVMKMLDYEPEKRLPNSDVLAYEVREALRLLDVARQEEPVSEAPLAMLAAGQEGAASPPGEEPPKAPENGISLYGMPSSQEGVDSQPSPDPVKKPRGPLRKKTIFFLGFILLVGAFGVAVQYPPCDKIWNHCYHQAATAVNDLARRQPILAQTLTWSGQKIDEIKGLFGALGGASAAEPSIPLDPPLSLFTEERKQSWLITNLGNQLKTGSTMQTGGSLAIQLPGVAEGKRASWREGYDHGRLIWSRVATNHYAFSACFLATAKQDPNDVTGLQIRGTDGSDAPWVFFGFLGSGDLFFQVRTAEKATRVVKHVRQPDAMLKYLMMVRRGNSFEALHSRDGRDWTPFARCTLDVPEAHVAGFFVATLNPDVLTPVKFDLMKLKLPSVNAK
jgi:serine/threonine protein kinase